MSLVDDLRVLLASTFALRVKTQTYHWCVTGPDFVQYHSYLNDLYEELDGEADSIAEHVRSLGELVVGGLNRFSELSKVQDETGIPTTMEMMSRLASDNRTLHGLLLTCRNDASMEDQFGVINFVEGLIDQNEKRQWVLDSIVKR